MRKEVLISCFLIIIILIPNTSAQKFFGSAYIIGGDQTAYEAKFIELFDQVTPEVYGKWAVYEPSDDNWQRANFDAMMNFASTNIMKVKEHTFIWESEDPSWIVGLNDTQIREEIIEWMSEILTRHPNIDMIDVVNEPLHVTPSYKDSLGGDGATGWDWVVWSFERAREIDSDAKLLVNEYNILSGNDLNEYIELITVLNDRNLIDGIGVQAHALEGTSSSQIQASLDELSQFGLPIYISELEVNIENDAQQETKYREIFPTIWDHPSVEGVTLWGFWEGKHWKPNGFLVHTDGTERPALVWLKEFFEQAPHCNDSIDNDGDGLTDMDDVGCVSTIDHYETNCGDSVCEGNNGETPFTCQDDCGFLTCGSCSIEAEYMAVKTSGSFSADGWGLWSNGYIAQNISFNSYPFTFEIIAYGSDCGDSVFPNMEFRIEGVLIDTFNVNSTSWASYITSANLSQGIHEIRVAFTNDCYDPPNYDRNLYVDKIITIEYSQSTCSSADTSEDSVIDIGELLTYISEWKSGIRTIGDLLTAISEWKNGC